MSSMLLSTTDDDRRQRILSARSFLSELQYPYGFPVVPARIDDEASGRVRLRAQVQRLWTIALTQIAVVQTPMMVVAMEWSLCWKRYFLLPVPW